jgi:hypothetical protein
MQYKRESYQNQHGRGVVEDNHRLLSATISSETAEAIAIATIITSAVSFYRACDGVVLPNWIRIANLREAALCAASIWHARVLT